MTHPYLSFQKESRCSPLQQKLTVPLWHPTLKEKGAPQTSQTSAPWEEQNLTGLCWILELHIWWSFSLQLWSMSGMSVAMGTGAPLDALAWSQVSTVSSSKHSKWTLVQAQYTNTLHSALASWLRILDQIYHNNVNKKKRYFLVIQWIRVFITLFFISCFNTLGWL